MTDLELFKPSDFAVLNFPESKLLDEGSGR